MAKFNTTKLVPLFVAIGVVSGILLGSFYANHYLGKRLAIINTSTNKLNDLLHLIDDQYVDTVDIGHLVEVSMPKILHELDPHSVYITKDEVAESMQDLNGSFSGIGVQFFIYEDTVRIVRVIKGGPSEGSGLEAGDRIVAVDGSPYTGAGVNNEETLKRLKGASGSRVKLRVVRAGRKKPLDFDIVRGDVPLKSVDAAFMLDAETGYIRISNFGDNTYAEFLSALARLERAKFKGLVLDLRGNLGGYMAPAVQIANEFLPAGRLIVYTQGRKSPRKDYRSDGTGTYQSLPLTVLVDEVSASSSEILSGAIQDNDRGIIIGRRTFGKGLVQVPVEFADGSMLRLTTARYYTSSGRCLQKPYVGEDNDTYEDDLLLRAEHGEYFSADSIKTGGEKYKTTGGRIVYGGGGIIPDRFVARDTLGITNYFREAYMRGLLSMFSYAYADGHRKALGAYRTPQTLAAYLAKQRIVEKFIEFAARNGLKRRNLMIRTSHNLLLQHLTAGIINDLLGPEAATEYTASFDPAVRDALEVIRAGQTVPELPAVEKKKPSER